MANHTSLSDLFTDIADAIRILNGTTEKIVADDFPAAILSAVKYSISKTLNNSTISNSAESIGYGSSYTATLTANSGHQIDSITITMGGVDITSNTVSGNTISIAQVTGDIVITVATSATTVTFTIEKPGYTLSDAPYGTFTVNAGTTWYQFAQDNNLACSSDSDGVWDTDYNMYIASQMGDISGGDVIQAGNYWYKS